MTRRCRTTADGDLCRSSRAAIKASGKIEGHRERFQSLLELVHISVPLPRSLARHNDRVTSTRFTWIGFKGARYALVWVITYGIQAPGASSRYFTGEFFVFLPNGCSILRGLAILRQRLGVDG